MTAKPRSLLPGHPEYSSFVFTRYSPSEYRYPCASCVLVVLLWAIALVSHRENLRCKQSEVLKHCRTKCDNSACLPTPLDRKLPHRRRPAPLPRASSPAPPANTHDRFEITLQFLVIFPHEFPVTVYSICFCYFSKDIRLLLCNTLPGPCVLWFLVMNRQLHRVNQFPAILLDRNICDDQSQC